jgi:type II secretion system protein J
MKRIREAGFTLVEIMLAVVILAVIMAIVYGVVGSTVEAQRRIEEVARLSEVGPALLSQIRSDLESAFLPRDGEYFVGIEKKGSTGDRDRVDFVAGVMAYGSEREGDEAVFHGSNEVGYQVLDSQDPKAGGLGVLYRREDYSIDAEPLKGGRLGELYDRVRHFGLEYYDGEKWLGEWNSKRMKNTLPQAVKVELRIVVSDREDRPVEQAFTTTVTFPR